MKIGDKVINTGLELARKDVRAVSTMAKIEERIRKMLLEKFGYILSDYEINQITRRENERGNRREESLVRSQWNIMRSKERAKLMESLRRDIQEGKLFKKHERKAHQGEGTTIEKKNGNNNFKTTTIHY
ncbi:MAG: hypothetical protein AABY26_02645 [Nanoarchaeota archaeon]